MHIKANGINLWCEIDGAPEKPWLIFSNSLATNVGMWSKQAAYFSKDFRVLRYDQRGHGKSDAPSPPYSFDILIADVIGMMDALDIKRAHFCGLSMGGATAFGLALKHPDRLNRIVVCDSSCGATPLIQSQLRERIATAQAQGMDAMIESTIARWFPPEVQAAKPAYIDEIRRMVAATPLNGFVGCSEALGAYDYRPLAKSVRTPTLFVVGSKDGTAPQSMRALHADTAGSEFVELPGAGHISNLDQTDLFNKAVDAFLKK